MSLRVFNVLKREKEDFVPITPGKINMYVCGPTVYDNSHLGHAKTYVSFDMIVRYLRYSGNDVLYVQNLTDVGHILPLDFYGRRGTVQTISAARVLDGEVGKESVQDRIVVIGTTVTAVGDVFSTPFDPVMPGVEVVATAIGHLLTGDGILRDRSTRAVEILAEMLADRVETLKGIPLQPMS